MADPRNDNRFLIVTGLSGSGKSVVARFLEDLGYYLVDNIPAKLIPSLVGLWHKKKVESDRIALIVDIREKAFLSDFPRIFRELRKKTPMKLIFLDASDECLVKRFSESRRPHPVGGGRTVLEGVRLERRRMAEIMKMADEVLDTSVMSIAELRERLARKILKKKGPGMRIVIVSFGYKYGIPLDSDLVFDTRFLVNPFYVERLKARNGRTKGVRDFVLRPAETKRFLKELFAFVDGLIPRFVKEGKSILTIGVGCTGGRHRSVVVAEELGRHLRGRKADLKISHRDIYK
jgi:RNase adapter protein RapZ